MKRLKYKDFMIGNITVTMPDSTEYIFTEESGYELDINDDSHADILLQNEVFIDITP